MLFGHYILTAGRTLNGVASMGFSGAFSAFNHLAALSALVDLKQNIKLDLFQIKQLKNRNIQKKSTYSIAQRQYLLLCAGFVGSEAAFGLAESITIRATSRLISRARRSLANMARISTVVIFRFLVGLVAVFTKEIGAIKCFHALNHIIMVVVQPKIYAGLEFLCLGVEALGSFVGQLEKRKNVFLF